uniref:WD_REPEATS_REGION domain-containing protein n=1 Tax=Steinernema glaseri TaxID=37863 RepID=A0A1I7YU81_9BILA
MSSNGAPPAKRAALDYSNLENPHEKSVMREFDRRKRARNLILPTDVFQVKMLLRKINQPISLFGEDAFARSERLRNFLSTMDENDVTNVLHSVTTRRQESRDEDTQTWFHKATCGDPLRECRVRIADYSLPRAKARLAEARAKKAADQSHEKALLQQEMHRKIQSIDIYGSQVVDPIRPAAFCEFSPDSKHIITAGWSGMVAVWGVGDCHKDIQFQGHGREAGCARFHPNAYTEQKPYELNAASCGHDGIVHLWNLENTKPLASFESVNIRISRIAFHPSGRYIASSCFDASWRLTDVETCQELLFQEGHSKAVFDVDFQIDGSLALSGGWDCFGRVWDLRTGRHVMFLEGHQKEINTVGWHPNGYNMITGGMDNTCKVWDLRMRRCNYTIAAHGNSVSRLKVDKTGEFMATSSFDKTIKIWSTTGWQPLRTFNGHETKIMAVDVSPCGNWLASVAHDRTMKLWTKRD